MIRVDVHLDAFPDPPEEPPGGGSWSPRLAQAVRTVLSGEGIRLAEVSVAVVDDPTIHELNRRHLGHDWPTDALSFLLDPGPPLEGEIVVSWDTAARAAAELDVAAGDELLLYVVHAALHLAGWEDSTPEERAAMRGREICFLRQLGCAPPPWPEPTAEDALRSPRT